MDRHSHQKPRGTQGGGGILEPFNLGGPVPRAQDTLRGSKIYSFKIKRKKMNIRLYITLIKYSW